MDTVAALRTGYLLSAVAITLIYTFPALRDRFLVYGPRDQPTDTKKRPQVKYALYEDLLDYVASIKVPHSWFKHFYLVSVVSSMVWLHQLYIRGPILQRVLAATGPHGPSMSFNQLALCWTLLTIQGSRRLYECITLEKPSVSQMWLGHYLLGILYYLAMGVSIWIEGAPALISTDEPLGDATISTPSISTFIFVPIFLIASGIQHDIHCYLNSLRKYTLPSHPAFGGIVSPHYTAEVAIYFSLMFLAAPKSQIVNKTILAALIFVIIELGVSADISKKWYMRKFDPRLVEHKWRIIPRVW